MPERSLIHTLVYASLMCVAMGWCAGCDEDRKPRRPFFLYVPPVVEDMGTDQADLDARVDETTTSPECEGIPDGNRCAIPNGTGICVDGRCQLLACQSAFESCDDDPQNGCEQDITLTGSCGGCEVTCRAGESCQSGERGYVCSAGVACPTRRLDLDADASNGCEWRVSMNQLSSSRFSLVFLLERGAMSSDSSYILAGRSLSQERVVGTLSSEGARAEVLVSEQGVALGDSPPLSVDAATLETGLIGWGDGRITRVDDTENGFLLTTSPLTCASGASPQGVLSVSVDPQTQEAFSIQGQNLIGPDAAFGPADYTRAFFPYASDQALTQAALVSAPLWRFAPQEVAACTPCVLDQSTGEFIADAACWGPAQCQGAFDASTCDSSCTVESIDACPDFSPLQVIALPQDRVVVLTRRGVVLLERAQGQWTPLARLESSSLQADAVRVRAGTARTRTASVDVALILDDGTVRALSFAQDTQTQVWRAAPLAPDFALALMAGSSRLDVAFGPERTLALTDGRDVWLASLSGQGTRVERVLIDDLPGTYTILDVYATQDGFAILRDSSNAPVVNTITLEP